jgi:hypothetical protein
MGSHSLPAGVNTVSPLTDYLATTNLATNAALFLEVTGQFASTSAGNSCRCDILTVDVVG